MQKFKISNSLKILLILVILLGFLNIPATTKQRIDSKFYKLKIPLYIKIIEFVDRDYNYKKLTSRILADCRDDQEKVLSLFEWTHKNIKTDVPGEWPVMDDHVWSIVIRGYGAYGQLSDVFTTLCVYAGFETRLVEFEHNSGKKLIVSAVKIKGKWTLFDPYYRVYFKTSSGRIATVKDLLANPSLIGNETNLISYQGVRYAEYFDNLSNIDFDRLPRPRAYRQNFFKRIFYDIINLFRGQNEEDESSAHNSAA